MSRRAPMTAGEFLDWSIGQPDGRRHALVEGCIVALGAHGLSALRAREDLAIALRTALRLQGCGGTVLADGAPVTVDARTVYPVDVALWRGGRIGGEAVRADAPEVLCDVLTPLQISVDTGRKLIDLMTLSSVRHYLLVDVERRALIHHRRAGGPRPEGGAAVETRLLREGPVALDGPDLTLHVEDLFVSA